MAETWVRVPPGTDGYTEYPDHSAVLMRYVGLAAALAAAFAVSGTEATAQAAIAVTTIARCLSFIPYRLAGL
jgi:hypothetical protein